MATAFSLAADLSLYSSFVLSVFLFHFIPPFLSESRDFLYNTDEDFVSVTGHIYLGFGRKSPSHFRTRALPAIRLHRSVEKGFLNT